MSGKVVFALTEAQAELLAKFNAAGELDHAGRLSGAERRARSALRWRGMFDREASARYGEEPLNELGQAAAALARLLLKKPRPEGELERLAHAAAAPAASPPIGRLARRRASPGIRRLANPRAKASGAKARGAT